MGIGLMYEAIFHGAIPFAGIVGWLVAAWSLVLYVQVEFQAALGTLRLHPHYSEISVSKKIQLWGHLMQTHHWLMGIVSFGLIWVGLSGFLFIHPYVFISVIVYGSLFTVLGVGKYFMLTEEEFNEEMGGPVYEAK
ncbi:hypothetical protein [Halobacterium wangiae]|uniref:hypothetical protein n=1 Tax=Halobacterium wangiae TaxID=2902623 RepID=UPI001E346DBB|nr:hypothetical protein [Halobacterium wangiae]